jgi:hypothetical protein
VGDSRPPDAAPVDLVNSYARRRPGRVEVVLAAPAPPLDSADAVMVLRAGAARVRSRATVVDDARGRRLVASFPEDELGDGQYRLVVVSSGIRSKPGLRLLVQGRRPVVLLWGDRPNRPQADVEASP